MHFFTKSRDVIVSIIFLLYLAPISFLAIYTFYYTAPKTSWAVLFAGLFIAFLGAALFFCLLGSWEKEKRSKEVPDSPKDEKIVDFPIIPDPALENIITAEDEEIKELKSTVDILQNELSLAKEEIFQRDEEFAKLYKESQKNLKTSENALQELSQHKIDVLHQLEQNAQIIENSQQTITEQRNLIEKKHQYIAQLETKVRDLTYEIKTLLQLAEIANQSTVEFAEAQDLPIESFPPLEFNPSDPEKEIKTLEKASLQLKRCVDIAQKITGGSHYRTGSPRFLELAGDNYTLDLRRLFDGLRHENHGLILFYSQKENKILFANNQSKNFLGWGSDKFLQNFSDIIAPGIDAWKSGISQLAFKNQEKIEIEMKNRSGQDVAMHGMLGIVPTGIFRNHILGVLWPHSCII